MNTELIKLSRKAAQEWAVTDGCNQASQLINMLCDELEASAPKQPLEPKEKACRSIAKLLADDIREAEQLAMTAFGTSNVFVKRINPTIDPQVYEI